MKSKTPSSSPLTVAAVPATPDQNPTLDRAAAASGFVRILLSLDLPQDALPQFESDCSLIAITQRAAPDLVPELVAAAVARLQRHPLRVTGVAVVERVANPLECYGRRALAEQTPLAA